jgi:hypothetical protein
MLFRWAGQGTSEVPSSGLPLWSADYRLLLITQNVMWQQWQ